MLPAAARQRYLTCGAEPEGLNLVCSRRLEAANPAPQRVQDKRIETLAREDAGQDVLTVQSVGEADPTSFFIGFEDSVTGVD